MDSSAVTSVSTRRLPVVASSTYAVPEKEERAGRKRGVSSPARGVVWSSQDTPEGPQHETCGPRIKAHGTLRGGVSGVYTGQGVSSTPARGARSVYSLGSSWGGGGRGEGKPKAHRPLTVELQHHLGDGGADGAPPAHAAVVGQPRVECCAVLAGGELARHLRGAPVEALRAHLRARGVTLRGRRVTSRGRGVTSRGRGVTLRGRRVMLRKAKGDGKKGKG
eukprot:1188744-Prorocentrum_minimum.AAC.2